MNRARRTCILLLAAALLTACDDTVDPILETDLAYSLYGVLSPCFDMQSVRVYPVEDDLRPAGPEPLDAVFTSTELETGEERMWTDSLFTEPDGDRVHIFYTSFAVRYGRTYHLEVRGEDGKTARAEVAIPSNLNVRRQPAEITYAAGSEHAERVVVPYAAQGAVDSLQGVEATYVVVTGRRPDVTLVPVTLSHDDLVSGGEGRWIIELPLKQIRQTLQDTVRKLTNAEVSSVRLNRSRSYLRILVLNEEWQEPEGGFDPDVLVEPGLFSNVEGGLGFVGGGYRKEVSIVLPDTVLDAAGFATAP